MAGKNGLGGDVNTQQARASTRQSPVIRAIKIPANSGSQPDSDLGKETQGISTNTVPYYKLFSFADSWDYLLMLLGTVTAVGNGLCLPAVAILFGELLDAFGITANTDNVLHEASKVLSRIHHFNNIAL